jgi:predicted membrane-bound spermidine synthase
LRVAALLLGGFVYSTSSRSSEDRLHVDQIVHVESSRAQRIVVTRWRDDWRCT